MKKFTEWLNTNPKMATTLCTELGINATNVSNVKHERRLMPNSWMPVVAKLSKGKLTIEYLVLERNKLERKLNRRAA